MYVSHLFNSLFAVIPKFSDLTPCEKSFNTIPILLFCSMHDDASLTEVAHRVSTACGNDGIGTSAIPRNSEI